MTLLASFPFSLLLYLDVPLYVSNSGLCGLDQKFEATKGQAAPFGSGPEVDLDHPKRLILANDSCSAKNQKKNIFIVRKVSVLPKMLHTVHVSSSESLRSTVTGTFRDSTPLHRDDRTSLNNHPYRVKKPIEHPESRLETGSDFGLGKVSNQPESHPRGVLVDPDLGLKTSPDRPRFCDHKA